MPRHRHRMSELSTVLFLTDGGLETTLVFHDGIELPGFAAFVMLESEERRLRLGNYYRDYLNLARSAGMGFILESVTWRANPDWGRQLGYSPDQLAEINRQSIEFLVGLREEYDHGLSPIVISGCIGPRGDGYSSAKAMSVDEAEAYHHTQIATLRDTEADLVSAYTLPYTAEAAGIARAARDLEMPVVISFTVETDGRLPSGETLQHAVEQVDALSNGAPEYYMINCAHPTHFSGVLNGDPWVKRIRAIRANASMKSHAELDNSTSLDSGDPVDLGARFGELARRLEHLNVFGGCCGTDHRHAAEICKSLARERGIRK